MAEYSFVDIFATKGIEYMVVIAYFILLVVFTKNLNAPRKKNKKSSNSANSSGKG